MRAMILAAGRGDRMRHLTQNTPKPLLRIKNRFLIEYSIEALANIGIKDIVINIAYCREKIKSALGNGSRYGVVLQYSEEEEALETGGGIFNALPLLGKDPFIVMSCDIISDYPLQNLRSHLGGLAHIVLVDNPDFHPTGDFYLEGDRVLLQGISRFTFANIGIYRPELFAHSQPGKFRLGDLLKEAIRKQQITGEYYKGVWHNIGTPEQLAVLGTLNRF
jgi:MurNAc alpha-1-phosphate uridylyltransferase